MYSHCIMTLVNWANQAASWLLRIGDVVLLLETWQAFSNVSSLCKITIDLIFTIWIHYASQFFCIIEQRADFRELLTRQAVSKVSSPCKITIDLIFTIWNHYASDFFCELSNEPTFENCWRSRQAPKSARYAIHLILYYIKWLWIWLFFFVNEQRADFWELLTRCCRGRFGRNSLKLAR